MLISLFKKNKNKNKKKNKKDKNKNKNKNIKDTYINKNIKCIIKKK